MTVPVLVAPSASAAGWGSCYRLNSWSFQHYSSPPSGGFDGNAYILAWHNTNCSGSSILAGQVLYTPSNRHITIHAFDYKADNLGVTVYTHGPSVSSNGHGTTVTGGGSLSSFNTPYNFWIRVGRPAELARPKLPAFLTRHPLTPSSPRTASPSGGSAVSGPASRPVLAMSADGSSNRFRRNASSKRPAANARSPPTRSVTWKLPSPGSIRTGSSVTSADAPHAGGARPLPGCLPPLLPRPFPGAGRHGAAQRRAARAARRRRVHPELRRIEVIEVRYEAGRFGRGFKAELKRKAGVRVVPMCEQVRQVIGRQLPAGARPDDLVFPGPGGSNGIPRGARTPLSTHNLRRVHQAAVSAAGEDLAHLDLHGPHDLRHTFRWWRLHNARPRSYSVVLRLKK